MRTHTIKVNVPAGTLLTAPVIVEAVLQLEILVNVAMWQNCALADADKTGFQLLSVGNNFYPSNGKGLTGAEDGYSPIPLTPYDVTLHEVLNGPPYSVKAQFYNLSGNPIVVNLLLRTEPRPLLKVKHDDNAPRNNDPKTND